MAAALAGALVTATDAQGSKPARPSVVGVRVRVLASEPKEDEVAAYVVPAVAASDRVCGQAGVFRRTFGWRRVRLTNVALAPVVASHFGDSS